MLLVLIFILSKALLAFQEYFQYVYYLRLIKSITLLKILFKEYNNIQILVQYLIHINLYFDQTVNGYGLSINLFRNPLAIYLDKIIMQ